MSGNGTFLFYEVEGAKEWSVGADYEAVSLRKRYLIPILEDLNTPTTHMQHFGYHVCDVKTEDLK